MHQTREVGVESRRVKPPPDGNDTMPQYPAHWFGDPNLTSFLAVWGAIVSSVTAGWTLYRDLRDRAQVKLSADLRRIAPGGEGKLLSIRPDLNIEGASQDLYVVVTAVNVGRRPMRWEGLGGYYYRPVNGKKGFRIITRELPKLLGEMEAHTELADFDFTDQFAAGNVRKLQIWDGAGGEWSVPRREIKEIADDAQKYRARHDGV